MARFRDIKNVSVFGTSWTGVQDVTCPIEAESFDYSAEDQVSIRRVDITKKSVAISISVRDPLYKRDISAPQWGSSPATVLNEVLRCSMTESADEIVDSAEDDEWITYVGITRRVIEAELEMRDFNQIYNSALFGIGLKDKFQFDVLPGATLTGLADRTAYERFYVPEITVTGVNPNLRHGELHSATISMRGGGDENNEAQIFNILSDGGVSGFEKHCGNSGTIEFTAPAAIGGSGGDKDVSIENCVLTRVELVAVHGGGLERTFSFRAYSSDGITSPITVT